MEVLLTSAHALAFIVIVHSMRRRRPHEEEWAHLSLIFLVATVGFVEMTR